MRQKPRMPADALAKYQAMERISGERARHNRRVKLGGLVARRAGELPGPADDREADAAEAQAVGNAAPGILTGQMVRLIGAERTAFFRKHRAAILREARAQE